MAIEDTVVFVVNVAVPGNEGQYKDFMKNAKELMKNMIERMIFNKPKSEAGIVLMGVSNDNDDQDALGVCDYQDIHTVDWELVENIEKIESNEGIFTKWMSGLRAALRLFEDAQVGKSKCKIVVISNFPEDSSLKFKNFETMVDKFRENEIELICCGTKVLRNVAAEDLNENEKKMLEFCQLVEGWYAPFDYVLSKTRFYETERSRFCPWRANLELATMKIPVRVVVRVSKPTIKSSWELVSVTNDDGTPRETPIVVTREKQLVDRHKAVHDKEDTVRGYMCGKTFIPVSEADEEGMKLPAEKKSFQLYGVAKADSVPFTYRSGPTTWLVFPQEGAEDPFFHLVKAMKNLNLVGFVRRIYQNEGRNPVICVLTPCIDHPEHSTCFVMHQLIFAEEEAMITAESLASIQKDLTNEELNAIDNLIDSMLVEDDEEGSKNECVRNPVTQHLYNVKAFRALHPDGPLPDPKDYLLALLEPPESIDRAEVKACVEKIRELFNLKTEEVVQVVKKDELMEVDGVQHEIAGSLKKNNSQKNSGFDDVVNKKEKDAEERECVDLDDVYDI